MDNKHVQFDDIRDTMATTFRAAIAPCKRTVRSSKGCRKRLVLRAEAGGSQAPSTTEWAKLMPLDEVPPGTRKLFSYGGLSLMLFWYRNKLYCVESRSPAEGAYSEGFIDALLSQEYTIECPTTKTTFDIRTGKIMDWYPDNPVLAFLTPKDTCRDLVVVKVKTDDESVYIDASDERFQDKQSLTKGGYDTSAETNNVFGLEPKMYVEGRNPGDMEPDTPMVSTRKLSPATLAVSTLAVAVVAVTGSAVCLYFENLVALGLFWLTGFSIVAYFITQFASEGTEDGM